MALCGSTTIRRLRHHHQLHRNWLHQSTANVSRIHASAPKFLAQIMMNNRNMCSLIKKIKGHDVWPIVLKRLNKCVFIFHVHTQYILCIHSLQVNTGLFPKILYFYFHFCARFLFFFFHTSSMYTSLSVAYLFVSLLCAVPESSARAYACLVCTQVINK